MKSVARGHFKAGFDSVRSTKLRSFWTMLGIIIGVASVISIVGIGEGVKQQISGQIHHLGKNVIIVRPAQLKTGATAVSDRDALTGLSVSSTLSSHDVTVINKTDGVDASSPLSIVTGKVTADHGQYKDGYVIGAGSDLSRLLNQSIAYGSYLNDDDNGTNVAVIGKQAAESLFDAEVPLGHILNFHGQQFIVKGIFNEFNSAPLSRQVDLDNAIFIPYDTGQSLSKNTAVTYEVLARAADQTKTDATVAAVQQGLDRAHGGSSGLSVSRGDQNIAGSDYILDVLTRAIAGVAAISLLVGGIGIMNVMLVSVAERMHEIGIRKAVGATNRQILNQFLVESSILSFTGGIVGILIALSLDGLLRVFTDLRPVISWQLVLLASGVSLLVGVIFGSVPALKAARKDPIEALRSD